MHFYNPVITSPYKEFVQTFGEEIGFGYYCEAGDVQALYEALKRLFMDSGYEGMCKASHHAVQPFTWESYMGRVMQQIRELP
jgi:glycosyltransferase involved in cell wall biosynthesis